MSRRSEIPFFRPSVGSAEVRELTRVIKSGWLTTGKLCQEFETEFADRIGAKHAIALNSCTAALHLALKAIGLEQGDLVLVPTMTFAATAEVVQHLGAVPVLIDCEPRTLCIDPEAVRWTLDCLRDGEGVPGLRAARGRKTRRKGSRQHTPNRKDAPAAPCSRSGFETPFGTVRAIIPVHYGGQMADMGAIRRLAEERGLYLVEDAAHAFPAAYRENESAPWLSVGTTGDITCFSFYANKTITTGEGGMAVTDRDEWAATIRLLSLHGISHDAWNRYSLEGSWYYEILAPGYKYNLTDISAAIGIHQLRRADSFARRRQRVAERYRQLLEGTSEIELPTVLPDRKHSWHLFVIRLRLDRLRMSRAEFINGMRARGIGTSVHWMPLHMHPYYRETFALRPDDFPVARAEYERIVSLPIYPSLSNEEIRRVVSGIKELISGKGVAVGGAG